MGSADGAFALPSSPEGRIHSTPISTANVMS